MKERSGRGDLSCYKNIPEFYQGDLPKIPSAAERRTPVDKDTIVVAKIKAQLSRFSGIISKGFSKPKRRLIKEMLYGIQATKDVKLSNISRSLREEQDLIKTEDRLSRNLDDVNFTSENDQLVRAIDTVSRYVGSRGIWAIDRGGDRGISPYGELFCRGLPGPEHEVEGFSGADLFWYLNDFLASPLFSLRHG
jgi:hypothetical protein